MIQSVFEEKTRSRSTAGGEEGKGRNGRGGGLWEIGESRETGGTSQRV